MAVTAGLGGDAPRLSGAFPLKQLLDHGCYGCVEEIKILRVCHRHSGKQTPLLDDR